MAITQASTTATSPSTSIGDYELGPVLGVGTVGTVYSSVEKSTRRRFALKHLHPGVSGDPLIRARFKREMVVMQRLQHPHIVAFYGGGEVSDGSLFYVMELVDGGTVKDLLETHQQLPWPAVVELGRQLCSALQCAHNNGVVHRDLKPGNLFLNRDAELKLGDFGIARDLTNADLTSTGMTVGTHGYMAPEQITGNDLISGKADLYSLGCCLFEMLTGRTVFDGENFAQLFEQHLHQSPPRVSSLIGGCPPELDAIVNDLLAKQPDDRPFNARQVQAVMIELGDRKVDEAQTDRGETRHDVGAASVASKGRELLIRQISGTEGVTVASDVSWVRLVGLAVLIGLIVLLAFFLQK